MDTVKGFDRKQFGKRLKEARKRTVPRVSQAKLADIMETEQPTVSRWESGDAVPSIEALGKLCRAVNVAPLYLLTGLGSREFAPDASARKLEIIRAVLATPLEDDAVRDLENLKEIVERLASEGTDPQARPG